MKIRALFFVVFFTCIGFAEAQTVTEYKRPSADIVTMLEASQLPQSSFSPDDRWMLLLHRPAMPTIADLAQPMYRLAGTRINPRSNSAFSALGINRIAIVEIATGRAKDLRLPANAKISSLTWSPNGRYFAFTNSSLTGLELWVAEPTSSKVNRVGTVMLNSTTGSPVRWLPDSSGLICTLAVARRGAEPKEAVAPTGPKIQESTGDIAPVPTFQDLLQNAHDEKLFKYFFTSQLAQVDLNGTVKEIGSPAIFDDVELSPDGKYIFVARVVEPYSYYVPYNGFAHELEVWDGRGGLVKKIASLPVAEKTPTGGVRTGPRLHRWQPDANATLVYVEALDGGDPKKKVAHRDRVLALDAPFTTEPRELFKTEFRFGTLQWTERGDFAIWSELDRPRRKSRAYFQDLKQAGTKPRLVFDLQTEDRYNNPGQFELTTNKAGHRVVAQSSDGQYLYLSGQGATAQGDRPFLRRLNISTLQVADVFRSQDPYYEAVIEVLDSDAKKFITSKESVTEPPNFVLHDTSQNRTQLLTNFSDPQPAFRKVKKELVKYKRSDGIALSGTLYLPPDYQAGEKRPTFLWAYPNEFASADAASQVTGSPNRFTRVSGASHLFLALQGYVVLDNAAMPILGGDQANDKFVEQLVMNAEAAINYLVERGVTDRDRVGVGGHSYGAFMTANLLAHSDLFRAGIARSGAYNRTLTPFSFQSERRSIWEVPDVYLKMSPFMHAHKVNEPILLLHGEADNNSGTFPVQTERFYHALKGLGKPARYVTLPLEAHGYSARESVLHTLYEMLSWMDRYVKNPARGSQARQ